MTKLFPNIIGQNRAKKRLEFYLNNYKYTGICPHLMFVGPRGSGKTTLANAVANLLISKEEGLLGKTEEKYARDHPEARVEPLVPRPKPILQINCSTIKNVKQLFNQIIIPHVAHKECTILFDEASELPKDVTMALLTILNPNTENRTQFTIEDYTVDFDFNMHTFMFVTTETQSIFHPLMDRCERVDLEEYTFNELGDIVSRVAPDVKFENGLLPEIATVLRDSARSAQKMAGHIQSYLGARGGSKFKKNDWSKLRYQLGILPQGLSRIELQILGILAKSKECSLTNLAAKIGLTPECICRDFEMYLLKHGLMEITTAGRTITNKGMKHLKCQ